MAAMMTGGNSEFYRGSCHCGNLKFTAERKGAPESVSECNCSYCSMTGFQTALSLPVGKIEETSDWTQATDYRFGDGRKAHRFCSLCGSSMAIALNDTLATVNVRMMYDDVPPRSLPVKVYDGATEQQGHVPAAVKPAQRLEGDRLRYFGGCHCGAVTYQLESEEITSANECACSICWRNAVLWRYPKKTDLSIMAGEENLAIYRWGSKGAGHAFCKTCGVKLFNMLADANVPLLPVTVRTIPALDVHHITKAPQTVRLELPDGTVVGKTMVDERGR